MSRFCTLLLLCSLSLRAADELPSDLGEGIYAQIETNRGSMWFELFFQRAPLTVANFVGLAEGKLGPKSGTPFYDGLIFHRVVPGFVIQGGDPLGTGEGGPGYVLPDEFDPALRHDQIGVLSMANDGPDTNGSQFFITLAPARRLDFLHSVFGRIVRGAAVIPLIQQGDRMKVIVHRRGARAREFAVDRASVDALASRKIRQETRSAPIYFADPGGLLPSDPPRARYFNYRLANVARVTGVRIFARVISAPVGNADARERSVRSLAAELGADRKGALAVYFVAEGAWHVVIGQEEAERFAETADPRVFQARVQALLRAAEGTAAAWIEEAEKSPRGLDAKQRIKLKVDGVLNALIEALVQRES